MFNIPLLANKHTIFFLKYFNSQKIMQQSHVTHFIFFHHLISKFFNHLLIISNKNQIINIKSNNKDLGIIFALHIEGKLTLASNETIFNEVVVNLSVPSTGSLFQTIYGFLQLVNFVFFPINNKALRLFNIDLFFQLSIQKCRFYVKLVQQPTFLSSHWNNSSNSIKASNWSKSLMEINTRLL